MLIKTLTAAGLLLSFLGVLQGSYASQNVAPIPVQIVLQSPQGLSLSEPRSATLVIRALPGSSLQNIRGLVIDAVDTDVRVTGTYSPLTIDATDSRFRTPIAFQIPQIQTEIRIPLSIRPHAREAGALELSFLSREADSTSRVAFQTLLVLEKTGSTGYETVSEADFLKRRINATSHADPLRSSSRKHHDPSVQERARRPQPITPQIQLPPTGTSPEDEE